MDIPLVELFAGRHPSTMSLLKWLEPNPKLPSEQYAVAEIMAEAIGKVLDVVGDGPETSAGLRKVLEAKDCFVRASLDGQD